MLLTVNNMKTLKGEKQGWQTFILHLSPAKSSGRNLCPNATSGCIAACLNTAGRGKMTMVQNGRLKRSRLFLADRAAFMALLKHDAEACIRRARSKGFEPAIRLNGTSDIAFERIKVGENANIMAAFPDVQFYDYTKHFGRAMDWLAGKMPPNYHLTFSRSEANEAYCKLLAAEGMNVAVVFSGLMPKRWHGKKVVTGEESDLRFLDRRGIIVGLRAKGRARQDNTGFVV
jgi:hypothetical protein